MTVGINPYAFQPYGQNQPLGFQTAGPWPPGAQPSHVM
jgi:hypothetical protein